MKLRIKGYELDVEFNENSTLLSIKNQKMFAKIVNDIFCYCKENQNLEIIFLDDKDLIVSSKKIEFIDSLFNFEINTKSTLTKLYNEIRNEAEENIDEYTLIKKGFSLINQSLLNNLSSYNLTFNYKNEVEILDVLKMYNLKIEDSKLAVFDKIISIIELYSEIGADYLIIFINILNFFDVKEMEEVLKYIRYKKLNVLFVENDYKIDLFSCKYVIDEEFDLYLDTIQNKR